MRLTFPKVRGVVVAAVAAVGLLGPATGSAQARKFFRPGPVSSVMPGQIVVTPFGNVTANSNFFAGQTFNHGFFRSAPFFSGYSSFYSYPYYSPFYPSYSYYAPPAFGYGFGMNGYAQSVYVPYYAPAANPASAVVLPYEPAPLADPNTAEITVTVPRGAELFIQGEKMAANGNTYTYVTPPLKAGQSQKYEVRTTWKENGREASDGVTVTVGPGDRRTVEFWGAPAPRTTGAVRR